MKIMQLPFLLMSDKNCNEANLSNNNSNQFCTENAAQTIYIYFFYLTMTSILHNLVLACNNFKHCRNLINSYSNLMTESIGKIILLDHNVFLSNVIETNQDFFKYFRL